MILHALISGRVQGVFFRQETKTTAEQLGLTGWVKNLKDGRVEVIAIGPKEKLETLLKWLHKGPENARVTRIESDYIKEKEFKIIY